MLGMCAPGRERERASPPRSRRRVGPRSGWRVLRRAARRTSARAGARPRAARRALTGPPRCSDERLLERVDAGEADATVAIAEVADEPPMRVEHRRRHALA